MMEEKLFLVIPAYNEAENIGKVIEEWYPVVQNSGGGGRLVVIDDGSSDETLSILREAAQTRPQMTALHKENSGHGATVLYGYRYALEQGADYVFQTDSDGQTSAEEFAAFWEKRAQYDAIIGSRTHRQDGWSRILVTRVLKLLLRLSFGIWVEDANTPYRLMKASVLKQYIGQIPEDYFLSNVLLSVLLVKNHCNVLWIPISFRPRQGGVNSIHLPRIVKIGKEAAKDFRRLGKEFKK